MNISDKIDLLDNNAKVRNEALWKRSEDSLALVNNPRLVFFIKSGLTFAIISIIIGCGLIAREFIKGDYPIYGKERIGAICQDGWESFSTGSGTCSHHGGVDYWKYPLVNYHYANPLPYYIVIIIAFSYIVLFAIINRPFRLRLIALLSETLYWSITFLYLFSYLIYIFLRLPFNLLYILILLFKKNKSSN